MKYLTNKDYQLINEYWQNPQNQINLLQKRQQLYKDNLYQYDDQLIIETQEGVNGVYEAIKFLNQQKPLAKLTWNLQLEFLAQKILLELQRDNYQDFLNDFDRRFKLISEQCIQYQELLLCSLVFQCNNIQDCIFECLIDDGNPLRERRWNLFNEEIHEVGIAHGFHRDYLSCFVIVFSDKIIPQNFITKNALIPDAVSLTKKIIKLEENENYVVSKCIYMYTMKDGSAIYKEQIEEIQKQNQFNFLYNIYTMGNICEKIQFQNLRSNTENLQFEKINLNANEDDNQIRTTDFIIKNKLGEGSFGKVYVAIRKSNNQVFAMKVVSKERLLNEKIRLKDVFTEKEIMMKANHPFIVPLYFTFQDDKNLYYGMQLMNGGNLGFYLRKMKRFNEETAKFYCIQILDALQYLHQELHTIYRDLKPENILIDEMGYSKLTDFGLSTLVSENAKSICGTMNYIAPEVLYGQDYSYEIDFWSLGCLVFEMISGGLPFKANNHQTLKKTIGQGGFSFPNDVKTSEDCWSFIQSLLVVKIENRLGHQGVKQILEHPWLKSINQDEIRKKKYQCPLQVQNIKPESFNKGKTEHFSMDIDYNVEGFTWRGENKN